MAISVNFYSKNLSSYTHWFTVKMLSLPSRNAILKIIHIIFYNPHVILLSDFPSLDWIMAIASSAMSSNNQTAACLLNNFSSFTFLPPTCY